MVRGRPAAASGGVGGSSRKGLCSVPCGAVAHPGVVQPRVVQPRVVQFRVVQFRVVQPDVVQPRLALAQQRRARAQAIAPRIASASE
jgi:hypothetical protein